MESLSRQQNLVSARQGPFQSLAVNNASDTSQASAILNVTSSFLSYGEVLDANVNFRTTMVSTSSTPTPSTQTCPFYLLRDDARKLILINVLSSFAMTYFSLSRSRWWPCSYFISHSNPVRIQWQPSCKTWLWPNVSKEQENQGKFELVFATFTW